MIDCQGILENSSHVGSILVAACLQAEAAVKAAEIQAGSTSNSGWMTAASVTAAIGAVAAAIAAYVAAVRQVHLPEKLHQSEKALYARIIQKNLYDLHEQISNVLGLTPNIGDEPFFTLVIEIPYQLRPQNWQRHALLGENVAIEINNCYGLTKEVISMLDLVRKERHMDRKNHDWYVKSCEEARNSVNSAVAYLEESHGLRPLGRDYEKRWADVEMRQAEQ